MLSLAGGSHRMIAMTENSRTDVAPLRLEYWTLAADGYRRFMAVSSYLANCGLEKSLLDLVYLPVSQINGCAYCVDRHFADAVEAGDAPRRLNSLVVWRESHAFSERERAALGWAEAVTIITDDHAPDPVYEHVRKYFSDKELADLTYAVAQMNALNRIAISCRRTPG
jgi:AhpD family alkylhydroperoxidase